MVPASFGRTAFAVGVLVVALLCVTRTASAQGAWVEDPGTVVVGLNAQYVPSSAVVETPTKLIDDRPTENFVYTLAAEYVPIENLAIDVALPMAMVKYTGTVPHGPPGKWDDGAFHETLTDFAIGARYQLLNAPLALTPFVGFSTPMQNYEVVGFATGGRHLTQGHFGVSVGRTFEPYAPNLYVTANYAFTLSEHYNPNSPDAGVNALVESYSENRSDVDGEIGYFFLGGNLNVNLGANYRHTNGGISFDDFGQILPAVTNVHDPILKESFVVVGAGASYVLSHRFTIGAVFRAFVQGYNTRDQSLYALDFTWHVR